MSSFARSLARRRARAENVTRASFKDLAPDLAKAAAREMTRQAVAADPGFLAKLRAALGVS